MISSSTKATTNVKGSDLKFLSGYLKSTLGISLSAGTGGNGAGEVRLECTGTKEQARRAIDDASLQGYSMSVGSKGVHIKVLTPMGLFYGIQSLRQMLKGGRVEFCTVEDAPRFAYRGLMLDCSRHFWPVSYIKKQIDALAYFKMDRLHLHLTDAAGWRLEIKKYPKLTEEAAYRTQENWTKWWTNGDRHYCRKDAPGAYGGFYTQKEMKDIVKYAAERHITVIPEIEMPGHSEEVCFAYPEISCSGKPYVNGDLCVGNEKTFEFLENVLKETMKVFPSEYIHIGGDEASRKAWETCPKCQTVMKEHGLKTTAELQSYLTERIEKFLNKHGRKLMGWDEITEGRLAPNATVMSWRGEEGGIAAANAGHPVVMTPGGYCYLDQYQDVPSTQPLAAGTYHPLEQVYSYEPIPEKASHSALADHLIGVQGNLWTEYVPTEEHADYMIYPRLLAIAEIGWSKKRTSYGNFRLRALDATAQMRAWGYHPFDLTKEVGRRKESLAKVEHEAVGCKVAYNAPFSNAYKAAGDATLTDGLRGNWSYGDDRWQGFIDKGGLDVTIDMGRVADIHDISADFMQVVGPDVFYPSDIVIAVSEDGENFKEIARERTERDRSKEYYIKEYKWTGNEKARYIRYKATNGKGGWIFTDEIMVNRK